MLQFYNRIVNTLFPKSNNSTTFFPAIYGLRAVSVIGIILAALGISGVKGGMLGYTILFVVSGYLLTESIISQVEKENRVDILSFYKKRLSKMLPAFFAMIMISGILFSVLRREMMQGFRSDILPSVFQFNNWWQIFKHGVSAVFPLPLEHVWALSVLFQFVILWPLIIWLIFYFVRDERITLMIIGILAAGSFVLMAMFYRPENITHAYYGTDTRAFAFLIGGALAYYTGNPRDRIWKYPVYIMDILGGISIIGLLIMMHIVSKESVFLYRGGHLLAAIFTACILLSAFRPSSILARILSFTPLTWIGKASYGISLWYLPIIMIVDRGDGLKWWGMLLVIGIVAIFAGLSYRFIESPIRKGVIADSYRIIDGTPSSTYEKQEYKRTIKKVRIVLATVLSLLIISILCILLVPFDKINAVPPGYTPPNLDGETIEDDSPIETPKNIKHANILFIGDEAVVVANDALVDAFPNILVDVAASRTSTSAGPIYEAYSNGGWRGEIVVIALGNTGELYDSLEDIKGRMEAGQLLFVVNTKSPESDWEASNNTKVADFANANEGTYSVDWYCACEGHTEYFDEEGNLSQEGQAAYAELLKETIDAVLKSEQD